MTMREEQESPENWPFEDEPSTASFTTSHAIIGLRPIVHVVRGSDGDWQFLSAEGADEAALKMVALKTVLSRHPYIEEVADLPLGWEAWRVDASAPWSRRPIVGR